ncbi:MAG: phenylacetate--CoA ligase family protein, partial [Clostridiales bacterium]
MEITILDDWISRKINADINRENLESYHLQALRDNLAYLLEHNNFYKQLLKDYTINSLADMAKMPLMAEDDIVDDYFRLFCKSQKDAFRAVSLPSSGTEGRIKRLFFTEKEQNDTIDFFYHGMQTYVSRNERVLILFPGDKPGTVGQLLAEALGKFLAIPIILPWQGDGKEVLAKILALKPQHLLAQPWQILILSQLLMENPQNFFLKSILLSADYTDEALERSLAALWHCPVYQHYGMT